MFQDGGPPNSDVALVEEEVRRCGARVEVEVMSMQRKVRDDPDAAKQTTSPAVPIAKSPACEVPATVDENVGRIVPMKGEITLGCGSEVSRDDEAVEVGASAAPSVERIEARHGSIWRGLTVVDSHHQHAR